MLFSYSPAGLAENWLNATVIEMLENGMDSIDALQPTTAWPDCIPTDKRAILRNRHGLRSKVAAFLSGYHDLNADEKAVVRSAATQQTNLPAVLWNDGPCTTINALPE